MRIYTIQHPFYWSIALHARSLYVCILNQEGPYVARFVHLFPLGKAWGVVVSIDGNGQALGDEIRAPPGDGDPDIMWPGAGLRSMITSS
jgi:hypothetical protein